MQYNFYIVDDDRSIRQILKNIICQYDLGDVVGEADHGVKAVQEIPILNPHIVLVDLLLPVMDGISIVAELRANNSKAHFIMISQVTAKEMISKAYTHGIEFFINKPINVIEVLSVINKVKEKIKMQEVIQSFEKAMQGINMLKGLTAHGDVAYSDKDKIKKILSQLGIIGEAGSNDIVEILLMLMETDEKDRNRMLNQKMSELYNRLNLRYVHQYEISSNTAAIEQRIRRAINKALSNIANLGIEDYGSELFIRYSNTLFDFGEVRKQMDFIRGKSTYGGKISVKKFLEGIFVILKNE
ncbi:two-component system, response regulator YcbB [Geosporobacter subterraneus DSM 17957]|uniref:Stage 0 sporulation protein A homolog n=1 Tax=Geosporobacter subterraneus DSM 17957 TaxID=1121919 RepID=A0A1M6FUS7_9FIRM|nr:response regulator [Geosporobacter subterraneus]SHJ01424.1 two-component system, response regulator YcbB [Geosporobacter subterraneus DSM 17957]